MAVAFLRIIRLTTMAVVLLFSVITLALSAHLTSTTEKFLFYYKFAAMALAVSLISLITLPVLIIVDFVRRGAFTSMVIVELVWLGILWVLWLATGSLAASANLDCNVIYFSNVLNTGCGEYQAIQAFSFLTWLVLVAYWILLLVASIIGATRGHPVWTSTVKDNLFFVPAGGMKQEVPHPTQPPAQQSPYPAQSPALYPPQQSPVQYAQQGVPPQNHYAQV
jgi:hypothetical protein